MMELPSSLELNEFNRALHAVAELGDENQACPIRMAINLCSSVTLGGHLVDHAKTLKICSYAGLLSIEKDIVQLTAAGRQFLAHNPDHSFEVTDAQKSFLAKDIILEGPWQSRARDLFLSFSPNYSKITYELNIVDDPPPPRYKPTIYLLQALGVLVEVEGRLSVVPNYVASVNQLISDRYGVTQGALDQILLANRKLGAQAEEAIVQYERRRLKSLGYTLEADLVRRISQLDTGAGYDVESFEGNRPLFDYDRFIEVKASQRNDLRFFWTSNERKVAEVKGNNYWIYFVGNFRPDKADQIEPIMIQNPVVRLQQLTQVRVEVATYVITQSDNLPLQPVNINELKGFAL